MIREGLTESSQRVCVTGTLLTGYTIRVYNISSTLNKPKIFKEYPSGLTAEEIQEFKLIIKKVKNINLTDEESEDQAMRFVRMFRLLAENRF